MFCDEVWLSLDEPKLGDTRNAGHRNMTVAVSVPFHGGYVIAADSRTVSGQVTYSDETPKLYLLGSQALLAVCGMPFFNATVGEELERTVSEESSWSDIEEAFNYVVRKQIEKPQVFQGLAKSEYKAWFLLVGGDGKVCVQRYASHETGFVLQHWNQFPYGVLCDEYGVRLLLNRLFEEDMTLERAKLLAVVCIYEISKVSRSVGLPIQMGVVNVDEALLVKPEKVEQLVEVAKELNWKQVLDKATLDS